MSNLYSRRHRQPPTELRYDIPPEVRTRILAVFEGTSEFAELLDQVRKFLFKKYGWLRSCSYEAARTSNNPVVQHLYSCEDELVLDFIEAWFQQPDYDISSPTVPVIISEINDIFSEEGIGYEVTPMRLDPDTRLFRKRVVSEYPRAIRRDHQLLHGAVISPALELLSDQRLSVANSEILDAHVALREGRFEDAITQACSAFESFLKTLADVKGWPYDEQRDTCARLVGICRDKALFPSFYSPMLEMAGTIRNRLGNAHGRGPQGTIPVTRAHAEHHVGLVSSHMLLLARLSGLNTV